LAESIVDLDEIMDELRSALRVSGARTTARGGLRPAAARLIRLGRERAALLEQLTGRRR
jgi:hypothetical protein